MPHRESRRGGWRARARTSRGRAVVIASLVVLAWAMNEWAPAEPNPPGIDDARPPHVAAAGAPVAFATASHAALERGDLGVAALLTHALSREPLPVEVGGWIGGGRTADEFRELYEGDPGDAECFVFARCTPGTDWTAP